LFTKKWPNYVMFDPLKSVFSEISFPPPVSSNETAFIIICCHRLFLVGFYHYPNLNWPNMKKATLSPSNTSKFGFKIQIRRLT
jgi:hypothetical protein